MTFAKVKSIYLTHTNIYRDDNFFYNWVTHISIKDTVHTVKRKKSEIIYISLLLKIDFKKEK